MLTFKPLDSLDGVPPVRTSNGQIFPGDGRHVPHGPDERGAVDVEAGCVECGAYVVLTLTPVLAAVLHPGLGDVQDARYVAQVAHPVHSGDPRTLVDEDVVQVPGDARKGIPRGDTLQGDGVP
ncbi:hypothetical protein CDAR_223621 [Caerostris darwini]|uniref:Uncharacterized protein n=1 Tax=Caerostris darwini TaxID=1538125 RepID=A0AAV4S048_9ARAC|nr:hypothetical protein CDAR_223621 [Caerostris darwini]